MKMTKLTKEQAEVMTVKELKVVAKELVESGATKPEGFSKLNKSELVDFIVANSTEEVVDSEVSEDVVETPVDTKGANKWVVTVVLPNSGSHVEAFPTKDKAVKYYMGEVKKARSERPDKSLWTNNSTDSKYWQLFAGDDCNVTLSFMSAK